MGGRGSKSGVTGPRISGLKDNTNFSSFIRENLSNPDFMALGREEGMDAVKDLWYQTRTEAELASLHEISKEDAINAVRDAVSQSTLDGWFRDANSEYKPRLVDSILSNPGTLNAGMNIAYQNYLDSAPSNPMSFNKWAKTPQTMYRGEYGQSTVKSDIFTSYTPDRSVASSFGGKLSSIKVRPIDTLGSYQTTGEYEFLVPVKRRKP